MMKSLLTEKRRMVEETVLNQEALEEIAMELIKGNYKTINVSRDFHSFGQMDTTIEVMTSQGYEVQIKQSKVM
jgi:hypothetical protein